MKVIQPAGSQSLAAPSSALGTSSVSSSVFQSRLQSSVPAASSGDPTGPEIIQHSMQQMRDLLRLQVALSRGKDTLTSNILKMRHENAKNSIANIR
jgi:hypothetical protein